jgi:GNAT superfamily N-acetyltransferase
MASLSVESIYGPTRRHLLKHLHGFNVDAVGKMDHKPLTITARERNDVVGGLVGETSLGWLLIELLWVADEHRGKGLGKSLVKEAESQARKRGVRNAYLNTFSFQAPGFYKKLGYQEFGRLSGFPPGHSRHWMTKAL